MCIRDRYRKLNNELRRETTKAREKWWTEQCDEINNLYEKGQIDKMYAIVKNLDRKPTAQSKAILDSTYVTEILRGRDKI